MCRCSTWHLYSQSWLLRCKSPDKVLSCRMFPGFLDALPLRCWYWCSRATHSCRLHALVQLQRQICTYNLCNESVTLLLQQCRESVYSHACVALATKMYRLVVRSLSTFPDVPHTADVTPMSACSDVTVLIVDPRQRPRKEGTLVKLQFKKLFF